MTQPAREIAIPEVVNDQLPDVTRPRAIAISDILDNPVALDVMRARRDRIEAFFADFMKEDIDYGKIPGTQKRTLLSGGANKLEGLFQVIPRPAVVERIEDWDRKLFQYEWKYELVSLRTGDVVAFGIGSANSYESRYRYRDGKRMCPSCGKPTIIKGKPQYGGGWVCWTRERTGCGAQYPIDDPQITEQQVGRVENDDLFSQVNTVLKISKKRAKIDAMVSLLNAAGFHIEPDDDDDDESEAEARRNSRGRGGSSQGSSNKGATTGPETVTEAEQKKFAEAYARAGHKWPDVTSWAQRVHKVDLSKSRIPKALYEAILNRVSDPEPLGAPTGGEGKLL